MEDWEYKNIDDLVELDRENLGEDTKRDFSFYYIDISSVSEGKLTLPSNKIIFREAPSRARKIVSRGDVLMSTVRPNLKAFAYFDQSDDDYIASTGFAVLTARDQVDARFILYSILSDDVTNQIKALIVGSNYPAVNSNAVRCLRVLTPPYLEQTKIAEILSTVERAIEQTETLIAKQQCIKTGLMQNLLTRGIDEHGNLRSEQTHQFKDSPLGRIPVEWEVKSLDQLASRIVDGVHHTPTYVESGVPFIVITDLTGSPGIDFSSTRYISEKDHREFSKRADPKTGDVLVTKDGTLGVARIVPPNVPEFSIFVSVAMLRPKQNECLPELIWAFFESGEFAIQLGSLSAGTGLKHIHLEHFRSFLLRRPSIDEQIQIFSIISKQKDLLNQKMSELNKLKKLKTALMQDLLTGKKRVTALLNDMEGASL